MGVLLLQFLEAFRLSGFHPAIELLPAVIGRRRHLQGTAHIGHALAPVEELLSSAKLANDLLGSVCVFSPDHSVARNSPNCCMGVRPARAM